MRHNKKFNHLGRTAAHRQAMLANMAISLIRHKRISTTLAKAKALRVYVEPLLTKAKDDTTHSRRTVFGYLQNKETITELFREVAEKIADRPGGYTRILRTGYRLGDNAEMCIIELVDYNENMLKSKTAKKSTRTRRSARKATDVAEQPKETKAPKEKAPKPETEKVAEEPEAEVETTTEADAVVVEDAPAAETPEAPATETEKAE